MSCTVMVNGARSVQSAYNNASQVFTADGGTVTILGVQICDSGCSVDTNANGFVINRAGIYHLSYDVIFEATGAGTAEIQLYADNTPLPCSYSKFVAAAGGIYPMHVETKLPIKACYAIKPEITCRVNGAAGNVTHVCASVVRLA